MEHEITRELVDGYITAVAAALKTAGHNVDGPAIGHDQCAEIILPDAAADAADTAGQSLTWAPVLGWTAAHVNAGTGRRTGHTDLKLGIVPAPAVVVRAVEAIDAAPLSLLAGRVAPSTAGLLAQYEGGRTLAPTSLDLITMTEGDDAFEQCAVCGAAPTHWGLFVTESSNAVIRAAWCGEARCQGDRARSMLQTVPVEKTGGGFRVSVAGAERELRAARRDRVERIRSEGDGIRDRLHAIAESLDA